MYFMPDGSAAIVVDEAERKLEFRDPRHMKLLYTIETPDCYGINHADFSKDGTYAIFSCEFGGSVAKVDLVGRKVKGVLRLTKPMVMSSSDQGSSDNRGPVQDRRGRLLPHHMSGMSHMMMSRGMPQDVRIAPDGMTFYVADMLADGVYVVDGASFTQIDFIPTGPGAHGFCVSRDGTKLYVSNRGSHAMPTGSPHGPGSVSVIDFSSRKVIANWPIPGGGSPDMGGVSADGKLLWFAGRFDDMVYAFDTDSGSVTKIPVSGEPHGLAVWPQPGRYSLGHTGNMR
jgi:DNA-binding beta-propeller fold protein YncE